ncbi:MAG: hypothetical protein ACLQVX_04500 [Limisphaerales bacterium]
MRKPRGDCPLNRLSAERQDAVIEFAAAHTLKETIAWLLKEEVPVSRSSLSSWLSMQRMRDQMRVNQAATETLIKSVRSASKSKGCKWDEEEVQRAGQAFFSAMAMERQDPRIWNMTQRLALVKEQLALEQSKLKESLRTKLRMGLDAVARAFQDNPQAMMLYEQARALIDAETK